MALKQEEPVQDGLPRRQKVFGGKHFGRTQSEQSEDIPMEIPAIGRVKTLEELEREFQEYRIARRREARKSSGGRKMWQEWRAFILQTGCAMLAVYLLLTFVIGITIVHGDSMQPALHEQDIAVIWRLSNTYNEGDVVLFRKTGSSETLVKRVVAGPGDTVRIDDQLGKVLVNDVMLEEPYIYAATNSMGGTNEPVTLGENEYFVLGDNRQFALDSRSAEIGAVEKGSILGKIIFCIRPGKV